MKIITQFISLIHITLIILLFILLYPFHTFAEELQDMRVTNYSPVFFPVFDEDNGLYIAIRSYELEHKPYFLVVDPDTLQTYQKPAYIMKFRRHEHDTNNNGYVMFSQLNSTPYYKALNKYQPPSSEHYGYGLKHAQNSVNSVFLTIDMCPSYKPFEKEFFEFLVTLGNKQKSPLPIAISITNLWVIEHKHEFEWLVKQKALDITWINHSLSHVYYPDITNMEDNFLALPRTNIGYELLAPEQMLISKGLTPSVFFRLPGLISNDHILKTVNDFGLIPVSTDAWLAKGENPVPGSIILVHGNSNEPKGIEMFIEWCKKNNEMSFLPLQNTIIP